MTNYEERIRKIVKEFAFADDGVPEAVSELLALLEEVDRKARYNELRDLGLIGGLGFVCLDDRLYVGKRIKQLSKEVDPAAL